LTPTWMTSIDDERHAGAASGVNNAVARAAGLLAIAVFGAVAVVVFSREIDAQLAARHAPPAVRQAMLAQRLKLADAAPPPGADARMVHDSIRASFGKAFRINMLGAAALAVLSAGGAVVITKRS